MKGLSKREKTLIIIALIALFFYFYYTLFLSSIMDDMKVSLVKLSGYKQSIKNENDKNEVITKLKSEREKIETEYNKAIEQLPIVERNPEIVNNINKFAVTNGVEVININLGDPEEYISELTTNTNSTEGSTAGGDNTSTQETANTEGTKRLLKVPVQVSVETIDYHKSMEFLASMEMDKRFVEINSVIVKADSNKLETSISAYYYYVDAPDGETPDYDFSAPPGSKVDVFKN